MKNFITKIYALDDKCVSMITDAYLWALDWTGIYVGTIIFINSAPCFALLWYKVPVWVSLFFLICVMAMSCQSYWMQNTGNKIEFNAYAEKAKGSTWRWSLLWFNVCSLAADIFIRVTLLQVMADVCAILFWYIICIKIRDREKKKFLKFLLPKMAYGTNT